jgi:hypothetical protein
MTDITIIPEEELRHDLEDSYQDLTACEAAIKLGITEWHGKNVQERLDSNKHFIKVISSELARRNKSSVVIVHPKKGAK